MREVRGERRRNIWKKGRVDFKTKSLLFLVVVGGWRSVYNGKKKIVPAIETIYIPIVKVKFKRRRELQNYKITKIKSHWSSLHNKYKFMFIIK